MQLYAANQTSTLEGRIKAAISITEFAALGDPQLSEFAEIFKEGLRLERLRGMIVHGRYVFDAATARGGPTVVESVDGGTAEIVLTTELFASEARKIEEFLIRLERADALTCSSCLPSDCHPRTHEAAAAIPIIYPSIDQLIRDGGAAQTHGTAESQRVVDELF